MVKFTKTLHVAAARSRCFDLLRDWSRASSWDPAIVESTKLPGQPTDAFGVGTKWNIQFQPSPDSKPMSVDYTTTEYDAGEAGTKSTLTFSGNATFVRSIDTLEMTDAPAADGAPGHGRVVHGRRAAALPLGPRFRLRCRERWTPWPSQPCRGSRSFATSTWFESRGALCIYRCHCVYIS
eukprot:TRINITY_DN993_c0_g1_i3.p1 TRINITY_DN993_c0_g1~~TRINITY_DN993_c0_g1_i3.p1  ORF type:complete len:180 (-),score=39.22 TRINITY_DN993_c0_g1_i3:197-736(-)